MRSETFRVKKPGWVRIVNPDPIRILDMRWRYGSYVRIEPGGVFRTVSNEASRTLAMYQPPYAPSNLYDAPPDALVLYTMDDLRLLAKGTISDIEKFDRPMPEWAVGGNNAPAIRVRLGDVARVPRPRMVRAMFPHVVRHCSAGGPYRERLDVECLNRMSECRAIRPGGTMRVFTARGDAPRALLMVRYRANPDESVTQCESGAWFYVPEDEFLRMEEDYRYMKAREYCDRALVSRMLQSI